MSNCRRLREQLEMRGARKWVPTGPGATIRNLSSGGDGKACIACRCHAEQEPTKKAQDGPRYAQEMPKRGPRRPKMAQDGPREAQGRPKRGPRWPKMAQEKAQDGPREAQERPKREPRGRLGSKSHLEHLPYTSKIEKVLLSYGFLMIFNEF